MKLFNRMFCAVGLGVLAMLTDAAAQSAPGPIGWGKIARLGHYANAAPHGLPGEATVIWGLRPNPTTAFPAECAHVWLSTTKMSQSAYKTAVNVLLLARALDRPVVLWAHFANPGHGGYCQVDYVEMMD